MTIWIRESKVLNLNYSYIFHLLLSYASTVDCWYSIPCCHLRGHVWRGLCRLIGTCYHISDCVSTLLFYCGRSVKFCTFCWMFVTSVHQYHWHFAFLLKCITMALLWVIIIQAEFIYFGPLRIHCTFPLIIILRHPYSFTCCYASVAAAKQNSC